MGILPQVPRYFSYLDHFFLVNSSILESLQSLAPLPQKTPGVNPNH